MGYSPGVRKESDTTEQLHFHLLGIQSDNPKQQLLCPRKEQGCQRVNRDPSVTLEGVRGNRRPAETLRDSASFGDLRVHEPPLC